jgi:uncharacterized membrane-anchored protein YitT (DUF2179 family)
MANIVRKKILVFSKREKILEYAVITLGSTIFALAMVLFLLPYKIAPGGVTGLAVIINRLTQLPAGAIMLAFNIPIFLIGIKILGMDYSAKSLYSNIIISLFTDIFNEVLHLKLAIGDPILAPIFGGVVFGIGLGLMIKVGGGTSGVNTLSLILMRYTNLKQGASIFVMNSGIILVAGVIFKSADLALYGYLAMYASSVVIDMMVEGMEYARGAYIISDRSLEIADVVLYELGRGATALKVQGLYTYEEKNMLLVVVTRKEIHDLVAIVKKIDPTAFVIITPIHEVLGKGFRRRI